MGVASGDHALNPPQSATRLAWGSRSANVTLTVCGALGDGACFSAATFVDDGTVAGGVEDFAEVLPGVGGG